MSVKKNASVLYVSSGHLRTLVTAAFRKHGVPDQDAGLVADILIEANLRGHDSHGVLQCHHGSKEYRLRQLKRYVIQKLFEIKVLPQ